MNNGGNTPNNNNSNNDNIQQLQQMQQLQQQLLQQRWADIDHIECIIHRILTHSRIVRPVKKNTVVKYLHKFLDSPDCPPGLYHDYHQLKEEEKKHIAKTLTQPPDDNDVDDYNKNNHIVDMHDDNNNDMILHNMKDHAQLQQQQQCSLDL